THTGRVWAVAYSPDGNWSASGAEDGLVLVRDADSGQVHHTLHLRPHVSSVAFSPDGRLLAAATLSTTWVGPTPRSSGQGDEIGLWNPEDGTEVRRIATPLTASLAFSPDGRILAAGDQPGRLHLFEVATGRLLGTLRGHQDAVFAVAFSPDGVTLAS